MFAFYLMFNTNGEYIPLRKYSIEDGIMKLRSDEAIVHGGDILEFIGFRYVLFRIRITSKYPFNGMEEPSKLIVSFTIL